MLNRILLLMLLATSSWATSYDLTARVDTAKSQAGKLLDLSKVFADTVYVDVTLETVALGVTAAATFRDITVKGTSTLDTVLVTGPTTTDTLTSTSVATLDTARIDSAGINKLSVFTSANFTGATVTGLAVTVPSGGTGVATLAANGVLYGNGTGVVLVTAQGAANSILTANAGAPVFSASPTIGTSVTTPLVIGGTAVGSTATLQSTSGIGTLGAVGILAKVGNNGASTAMNIYNDGWITQPLQPSFCAVVTSDIANVTGDATVYTIAWSSERWDQGGNFSSTLFTAPVTGKYSMEIQLSLQDIGAGHTQIYVNLVTSNITWQWQRNPAVDLLTMGQVTIPVTVDMDANDTASITVDARNGTKTVDIHGDPTSMRTWWTGHLVH